MFGFTYSLGGDLLPRPGSGQLSEASLSSLIIRRKSSNLTEGGEERETGTSADSGWEELVTPNALRGLIPEVLTEQFEFWKQVDCNIINGVPRLPKDDWNDYKLSLHLDRAECIVRKQNQRESMVLLNLRAAAPDSPLGRLAELCSKLDSLSHVLVWSKSNPTGTGDEMEVSTIEFPRIRTRFVMAMSKDGAVRFHSLDHTGTFWLFLTQLTIDEAFSLATIKIILGSISYPMESC